MTGAPSLADQTVVITGGAGLLGRVFCTEVARAGATVVVADADDIAAARVATDIEAEGGSAWSFPLDITAADTVEGLIHQLRARGRPFHAVVNNAYPRNARYGRRLEQVTYEDFCENVNRHLGGYFLVAQRFALAFRAQGHGTIVNMASIYGTMAPRFEIYQGTNMTMPVEYAAIKAGVVQLTRYFAQYFKSDGIRCNCLSPGGIRDAQPDSFQEAYDRQCGQTGMLVPADLAAALIFLLSDGSRHITGQNIIVDDGFSL